VLVTSSGKESADYIFKLCDMGQAHGSITTKVATNLSTGIRGNCQRKGTISFEAPEVFENARKTTKSDVYSFAMFMYELAYPTNSHPWSLVFSPDLLADTLSALIIQKVKDQQRPPVQENSPYTKLMQDCWKQNPESRPAILEIRQRIISLRVTIITYF